MIDDEKKVGYLNVGSLVAILVVTVLGIVFQPGPTILWASDACYDTTLSCGMVPPGLLAIVASITALNFAMQLLVVPSGAGVEI